MKETNYWEQFMQSGRVEDYLNSCRNGGREDLEDGSRKEARDGSAKGGMDRDLSGRGASGREQQ